MVTVYIGVGSNLGDRESNCKTAVAELPIKGIIVEKISRPYITKAWGVEDQPDFVNLAVEAKCGLSPEQLLQALKNIEKEMGRQDGIRWGPRLIDLDILFYGDTIIVSDTLIIPHPLLHKRDFVLLPMLEIAGDLIHPELKISIRQLAVNLAEGDS